MTPSALLCYNRRMQKVLLYTKLDCSLCDKAYQMLLDLAFDIPLEIDIIDISHAHNNLETAYDTRIPVIALDRLGTELEWPFTSEDIKLYLKQ